MFFAAAYKIFYFVCCSFYIAKLIFCIDNAGAEFG